MKIKLEGSEEEVHRILGLLAGLSQAPAPYVQAPEALEAERGRAYKGEKATLQMIRAWDAAMPASDVEHWAEDTHLEQESDSVDVLRAMSFGPLMAGVIEYVNSNGGLTHTALIALQDKTRARRVAVNIAQVSSIVFPDLADTLEHHNPFGESSNE
jgi:hypothetical protein